MMNAESKKNRSTVNIGTSKGTWSRFNYSALCKAFLSGICPSIRRCELGRGDGEISYRIALEADGET